MHGSVMQEASFKEFVNRPENRPLMEKQQQKEVQQGLKLNDRIRALEFRDKVGLCASRSVVSRQMDVLAHMS